MGRGSLFQVAGCFLLVFLVVAAAPVGAETLVNYTTIGSDGSPDPGNGIARGGGTIGDDYNDITNYGDIWVDNYGIYNFSGIVTNHGIVYSTGSNAVKFGPYDGTDGGVGDTLVNFGTIVSDTEAAVCMSDGNDTLQNLGEIFVEDSPDFGIDMGSGNDTLRNSGTIGIEYASDAGIDFGDDDGGDDTLINTGSGTIIVEEAGEDGINFGSGDDTLLNRGTIEIGDVSDGIDMADGDDTLTNIGTINIGYADDDAIDLDYGNDTLVNRGTINIGNTGSSGIGDYGGNNTLDNSGTINIASTCDSGIKFENEGNDTLTNSGTINIGLACCSGIRFDSGDDTLTNTETGVINIGSSYYPALEFGTGDDTLDNAGTIDIGYACCNAIAFGSGTDTLTNSGTITIGSTGCSAIQFGSDDSVDTLNNSGLIDIGYTNYSGIAFGSGNDILTNTGTINVEYANLNGIVFASGDDTLTNSGTINIGYANCNGIRFYDGNDTLTNTGTGVIDIKGSYYQGLEFGTGDDTLDNAGTINIDYVDDEGIDMADGDDTLTNIGTINIGSAYYNAIAFGSGTDTLTNSGTITIGSAMCNGIHFGTDNAEDTLINSGTITIGYTNCTAITFSTGNDRMSNSGTIGIGNTNTYGLGFGDGNDILENSGAITIGSVNYGGMQFGSGNDTLRNTESGTIEFGSCRDGAGIHMAGDDDRLENAGTIMIKYANSSGIGLGTGEDVLENTGTINIEMANESGINLGGRGTDSDALINSGTINIGAVNESGIYFADGDDTLRNSGTIEVGWAGNDEGIAMSSGDDTLTNTGTIIASINMGYGGDVVNLGSTASSSYNKGDIDGFEDDDTLNLVGAGSVDGEVLDFETLTKTGSGVFALNDDVEVDDTATIDKGTLLINGDMYGSGPSPLEVMVNPMGTLGGNGWIEGNVTNDGTVAPGTSIGRLTIDGDYTQSGTGILDIEVDRKGADRLAVSNTATITGWNATVTPIGATLDGDANTVLTAGNLTGDNVPDGDVSVTSPVLSFQFDSDTSGSPDRIVMTTLRTPYQALVDTENQKSIARNLYRALPTARSDFEQFLVQLDLLPTAGALADAMDDISPEPYAGYSDISRDGINQYTGALMQRLGGLRGTAWAPESGQQLASASNTLTGSGPALASVPASGSRGWGVWAQGFGLWGDQDEADDNFGFDYNIGGAALGIDKALSDNLVVGISAGFSNTDVDYDTVDFDGDIDTYLFGIYATYVTDQFYVEAAASYADNDYESERDVSLISATAESDHDGSDYLAYLGAGYNISLGDWKLIPIASLQYISHEEDGFTESGAGILNLEVSDADSDSFQTALGVKFGRMFHAGNMSVLPEIRAQWAHEFGDTQETVKARFTGSPVAGMFSVDGVDADADSALVGAGVSCYFTDNFVFFVNWDAEFRSDFDANLVSGGLRLDF